MALYKVVVLTNSVPGLEMEFNDWYSNKHLADVVRVPGFMAAQRFEIREVLSEGPKWKYLAIYDVETDDPEWTILELKARSGTSAMEISPALDQVNIYAMMYREITPVVKSKVVEHLVP